MTKIIAVANQKGGVGKTTTAVNLSACLAAINQRVLLVDLDPQSNATLSCLASITGTGDGHRDGSGDGHRDGHRDGSGDGHRDGSGDGSGDGLGEDETEFDPSELQGSYQLLVGQLTCEQAIVPLPDFKMSLIPATSELTGAELDLLKLDMKDSRLKQALNTVSQDYNFIIIDCPPAINLLTLNALVAATEVLIPMQCEYFSLEGISRLMDTVATLRESLNPDLSIAGVLRTMYDPRSTLTQDVSAHIAETFGSAVFQTTIPRSIRLAEAPSYGKPILYYDGSSKGALAYLSLASEMVK